jgi:hypothetical protein
MSDKRQTRPLVRESAPQRQDNDFPTELHLVANPTVGSIPRRDVTLTWLEEIIPKIPRLFISYATLLFVTIGYVSETRCVSFLRWPAKGRSISFWALDSRRTCSNEGIMTGGRGSHESGTETHHEFQPRARPPLALSATNARHILVSEGGIFFINSLLAIRIT